MQLPAERVAAFRKALASVDALSFGLAALEIYPGATRYAPRSHALCRFEAIPEALAARSAQLAGKLMSARLGIDIGCGSETDDDGRQVTWAEYFPGGANSASAAITIQALQTACIAAAAETSGVEAHRSAARKATNDFETTPAPEIFVQSRFLIAAARRQDIPVHEVAGDLAWQFGWGAQSDIFYMTGSTGDSVPGHQITWRKHLAKTLLEELGLPTPKWQLLAPDSEPLRAAEIIGWPCVVKPTNQAFGRGVSANIRTAAELYAAVSVARQCSPYIIIEAQERGADHRLMVVDGELIAAVRREPPQIRGDGSRTVRELLTELNASRDATREKGYLLPVKEDPDLASMLARQGLSMSSVPAKGATIVLRSVANFSTGGSATDVTRDVHPQIRALAEQLAMSVGLRTAGIDYITPDISKGHSEVGGGFIEVNAMPRLRLLMSDQHAEEYIGARLLGERPGRIPVALILGSVDRLDAIAEQLRKRTAATPGAAAVGASWAQVGPSELITAEMDPYEILSAVLRNRAVEQLVILWSATEIEQFGSPVDKLERAIVLERDFDERRLSNFCNELLSGPSAEHALSAY